MRNFFRLFIPLCALVSCKPRVETITINVTPLPASSIYDADAVFHYLEKHADSNKELANYYFNKGIQNQVTDIPGAIHFIKRSLTLYPLKERYLKLGNLLYEDKDYEEMNNLYGVLVSALPSRYPGRKNYLFEKPTVDLVENYVVSNILAYNNVWNNKAEETSLTDSLKISMNNIKEKVLADGRITLNKPTAENKNVLWQFLTADEKLAYYNNESTSMINFINYMDDTSSIFEIDKNSVNEFLYSNSPLNVDWEKIRATNEKFEGIVLERNDKEPEFWIWRGKSRNWFDENFEKSFKINDSVKGVVYAIDTSVSDCPKDMRTLYHRLVTYRDFKHIIATKILAVQAGEQLSTTKFNHDKFTITYFKRYWEKPYKKYDFDNHLSKIEQTGERYFEINGDGTIKENLHE